MNPAVRPAAAPARLRRRARTPATVVRPCPDVDLLALHHAWPQRYPFLLESLDHQPERARYDILFAHPGRALALAEDGRLTGPESSGGDFLTALDRWYRGQRPAARDASPLPFVGGWFLLLGYELAAQIEPKLELPRAGLGFPVALAVRCPAAFIRDRRRRRCYLVAEADHAGLLESMRGDAAAGAAAGLPAAAAATGRIVEEPAARFLAGIDRIGEYILAGDVFQVNLSRLWRVPGAADPGALYAALRSRNPAPFSGLARWRDRAVVCSSPERLVQVRDGWVQTRPIAGTRPREGDRSLDRQRIEELIADAKERAEHIMLIDMERNDLGRVCRPGTVTVNELMRVESYAHVHHIVSNVRGRLRPDASPGRVIRAVFPGGTITGCPKVRCMQIIAELERQGRGPYTGSMGYLNRDGSMDLNILIRSMLWAPDEVQLRAGAGIVADSVPVAELNETRSKARGLLQVFRSDG